MGMEHKLSLGIVTNRRAVSSKGKRLLEKTKTAKKEHLPFSVSWWNSHGPKQKFTDWKPQTAFPEEQFVLAAKRSKPQTQEQQR